jgi:hypothetical protein
MNQPIKTSGERETAKSWYNLEVETAIATLKTRLSDGLSSPETAYEWIMQKKRQKNGAKRQRKAMCPVWLCGWR